MTQHKHRSRHRSKTDVKGRGKPKARGASRGAARVTTRAVWAPVPAAAAPAPIVPAPDPALLVRSLGDPPLQGQGAVAGHYLAAVVERAATVAIALAASAGQLADQEVEVDPRPVPH